MRFIFAGFVCATAACSVAVAQPPTVIIDPGGVPPAALRSINQAVESITRLSQDQDGGEVSRLRRRAHQATLSALETQGYFTPVVTLEVGQDIGGETWDITIEPGERTHIRNVNIGFKGQITRPEFEQRIELARKNWLLEQGMPFINSDWQKSKEELLDGINRKDFYFARYTNTQAAVRADQAKADLSVEVSSGPRVRLGEMQVFGLKRVPRKLVERYVKYSEGDSYDQDKLDAWQEALNSTSFFRGAFVTLDTEEQKQKILANDELQLPVRVQVAEGAARVVRASLGADSDHGARIEGLYRQNVAFGQPVQIETGFGADRKRQRLFFDVHLPPTASGYSDSVGVLADRSNIEGVRNSRLGMGWTRTQERKASLDSTVDYRTRLGVVLAYDKTEYKGAEKFDVPTLVTTWNWIRRNVDNIYDPRDGNLIDFGVGAGLTLDRSEPFYRSSLRAQKWWPIGKLDVLTVRGEVGKVWSKTTRKPEEFGYRTGGSRSIRGYRYNSIGVKRGQATIGADALALVSIEYMRYFTSELGMNIFIDAGDAAPSFNQMKWHFGYGVGAIYRTPAGPFSVSVAYGQKDRRLRLHFALGIAF